jgi:hypothetical protein
MLVKSGATNIKSPQLDIFSGAIAAPSSTAATHSLARSVI